MMSSSQRQCVLNDFDAKMKIYVKELLCFNQTHMLLPMSNPSPEINDCLQTKSTDCGTKLPYIGPDNRQKTKRAVISFNETLTAHFAANSEWFLANNVVHGIQYGHMAAKFMQYYQIADAFRRCGYEATLNYLSPLQSSTQLLKMKDNSKVLNLLATLVFGQDPLASLDSHVIDARQHVINSTVWPMWDKFTCYKNVWIVDNNEATFSNMPMANSWRKTIQLALPEFYAVSPHDCLPVDHVFFLHRTDGVGLRNIVNFHVIDEVLSKYNVSYRNVSLSGKNTSEDFLNIFSKFSLLISPHSSSLKTLVFSRTGSVVIELRARDPDEFINSRNPFGNSVQLLGLIYQLVLSKETNINGVQTTITSDVIVDKDLFESALVDGLKRRKLICSHSLNV